ncbi:MAG: RimK-like ATPgrasp N-terminal domain-containing protein [Methanoregulaceae archaeon]
MNESWPPSASAGYSSGSGGSGSAGGGAAQLPLNPAILPCTGKPKGLPNGKKDPLTRNAAVLVQRNGVTHLITEGYFYKSDAYYTILDHEMRGDAIEPSSSSVLDAYVVPICLEKASLAGIPVCEWGISHTFTPTPAIVYGLNYFATSAEHFVVVDNESSRSVIKHITNNGKYPFCFQKLPEGAEFVTCTAVFGKISEGPAGAREIAERVYEVFRIPLVSMVLVKTGSGIQLSALTPTRYSKLDEKSRLLLNAYIAHQEFL